MNLLHRNTSSPSQGRAWRVAGARVSPRSIVAMAGGLLLCVFATQATRAARQTPPPAPAQPAQQTLQTRPTEQMQQAAKTFAAYCAGCHGTTLAGGRAPTLLDDAWRFGGDDASLRQSIKEGRPGTEMAPFKSALSDAEVEALIAYLRTQAGRAQKSAARARRPEGVVLRTERAAVAMEVVAEGLATPWAIAFLPDGRMLVTERPGRLRVIEPVKAGAARKWRLLPDPIAGTPEVWPRQDGGLLDVAVHPEHARNGWLYLSYAAPGPNDTSMTAIVRGRVKDGRWLDQQDIYRAAPDLFTAPSSHYGSRLLFDGRGHLFYTIGDRARDVDAQDLSRPTGKIHRVHDDGRVPEDNPFVARAGAVKTIWSYGHRHPQGLAFHPQTGRMWETEHGPTGGDELNRIEPGHNYGWPLVTSGKMFPPPKAAPAASSAPGTMDDPIVSWTPAIAPAGITFYSGARVPAWKNSLFVTGLAGEALRRLETDGDKVVHEEILFSGFGRVRAVTEGPDGYLYVALNVPGVGLADTTPGLIIRLVPAPAGDDQKL